MKRKYGIFCFVVTAFFFTGLGPGARAQREKQPPLATPDAPATAPSESVDDAADATAGQPGDSPDDASLKYYAAAQATRDVDLPDITPGPAMTLEELLEAAQKRNLSFEAARLEIEKADAKLSQAYALVMPGAQASMTYMHNDHEDTVDFASNLPAGMSLPNMQPLVVRYQENLSGKVEVGMSLVNAKSWMTIATARRGAEAARAGVEDGRQMMLHQLAQGYFMALMARDLIALRETQVRSAAHHLEVAKARFDAGMGLRIDVIRAETDLEQFRQELISAHLSFDNARDALASAAQVDGLPLPVEAPAVPVPDKRSPQLVEQALRSHSDVAFKRAMVDVADTQLDASWMQFLPTLDVGWGLQYQFTKPADLGSQDRSRWSLVFTLSVPIYNHFRYADLDEKRASLRQAMIQLEETKVSVSTTVRKAQRDYLATLTSVRIADNQAKLAKEGLTLVEASYRAGTGSSLEVTDARRTLSAANVNLAVKRLEAQVNLLALLRSVGEDILESVKNAPPVSTQPMPAG